MKIEENVQGLDEDEKSEEITLISGDGIKFPIQVKFATISKVVKSTLEQTEDIESGLLLSSVKGKSLKFIVDYMNHHKGKEPPIIKLPLSSTDMSKECEDPWDAAFIDSFDNKMQSTYDLLKAANYMNIPVLLHLVAAKIGSLIKGKSRSQVCKILNPENDKL